ncbi:MAG: dihydroneopterin aldolase [Acidobacteria bacterium]|nr:dihydroneopterin aldolase [Acidobacteriota bacterium]
MDKIAVRGLKCELKIGVDAVERLYPQVCLVDLDLMLDLSVAARSDAVQDTVDYTRLCREICEIAGVREYHLVESFADAVAAAALGYPPVREVRVFVEKVPLPLQGKLSSVGVEILRKK